MRRRYISPIVAALLDLVLLRTYGVLRTRKSPVSFYSILRTVLPTSEIDYWEGWPVGQPTVPTYVTGRRGVMGWEDNPLPYYSVNLYSVRL